MCTNPFGGVVFVIVTVGAGSTVVATVACRSSNSSFAVRWTVFSARDPLSPAWTVTVTVAGGAFLFNCASVHVSLIGGISGYSGFGSVAHVNGPGLIAV